MRKNKNEIKNDNKLWQIALGEDSTRQFKQDVPSIDKLAAEMAAFANSEGGTIFIGVADDGTTSGLSPEDVRRINKIISNAASQHIHEVQLWFRQKILY
ncbi:MAG: ATP-binding protein [bacterium]